MERIVGYVLVALALCGGVMLWGNSRESKGYEKGRLATVALYDAASAANRAKQEAANNAAAAEARITINALQEANTRLEAQLSENAIAADKDPRRDVCGLGGDSVRRIDGIH